MSNRKKQSQKPLFKKKSGIPSAVKNVVLVIVLICVGFLIGKLGVGLLAEPDVVADTKTPIEKEPTVTTSQTQKTSESVTTTPDDPEFEDTKATTPPEIEYNGILSVSFIGSEDHEKTLAEAIGYAKNNNYVGICVELLSNGGTLYYSTENEKAINAGTVFDNALSLSEIADAITSEELLAYAKVSLLSDHIVSWYDKSCAYMFEDSSSRWLDNKASKGGRPWISPFSESSKEYIGSILKEISNADFAGVIATDIEFPPFRNSDLNYIGDIVKTSERYMALCDFTNSVRDAFGLAKSFGISVSAKDVILGEAEILTEPMALSTKTVYIRYDSEEIGEKLMKEDSTAISFAGLSEYHKIKSVFKNVQSALSQYDIEIIPEIVSDSPDELLNALSELGFERSKIVVIK